MPHRRLSVFILFFLLVKLTIQIIEQKSLLDDILLEEEICHCQNGGICSPDSKYSACTCPSGFIGTHCSTAASQISSDAVASIINQEFSYFYFTPTERNYYQICLKICLPKNSLAKLTNLIFLQVQHNSGKLKLSPSIYQTSPMSFSGTQQNCHLFYTHFIPIHKKTNDQYQKIIFGISIKNNSDFVANRWVNFLQNGLKNIIQTDQQNTDQQADQQNDQQTDQQNDQKNDIQNDIKNDKQLDKDIMKRPIDKQMNINRFQEPQNQVIKTNNYYEQQVQFQQIWVSCTYELYLVDNYWGSAIIAMSSLTLIISVAAFIYTIRSRYSFPFSNDQILRFYIVNPEEILNTITMKNDLSHFKWTMPSITYEKLLEQQKKAKIKLTLNMKKHLAQFIKENNQLKSSQERETPPEGLSETSFLKNIQQKNIEGDGTCTICLLNFEIKQKVRKTPCNHVFHTQCIDNWCQNTLNCPICRKVFNTPRYLNKLYLRALLQS